MADNEDGAQSSATSTTEVSSPDSHLTASDIAKPPSEGSVSNSTSGEERAELVSRARAFLTSPQIKSQDILARRKFLSEKGLNDFEINGLLSELPPQVPSIPPRTYPQLPPSNLPNLLLGLARIFSWVAGGSAALILLYYRFLLPRITRTLQARQALRSHHVALFRNLTTSLASLKESQSESLSVLPRVNLHKEPSPFAGCRSIQEVLTECGDKSVEIYDVPPITLLRCALEDFSKTPGDDAKPSTEELFRFLEGKIPWLVSDEGVKFENKLWETLATCPLFEASNSSDSTPVDSASAQKQWTYMQPEPHTPPPLLSSLSALSSSLPRKHIKETKSTFQHTLQSLSDFTGYISTQVYLPYRPVAGGIVKPGVVPPSSAEEELKKEIRALKGLVLNRRSFMPSIPRQTSMSSYLPSNPA